MGWLGTAGPTVSAALGDELNKESGGNDVMCNSDDTVDTEGSLVLVLRDVPACMQHR